MARDVVRVERARVGRWRGVGFVFGLGEELGLLEDSGGEENIEGDLMDEVDEGIVVIIGERDWCFDDLGEEVRWVPVTIVATEWFCLGQGWKQSFFAQK